MRFIEKFDRKIVAIEIILLMMFLMVLISLCPTETIKKDINLKTLSSSYMQFEGESWVLKESEEYPDADTSIITSHDITLAPGTYTITIQYSSDNIQSVELYSDSKQSFIHANTFKLSKNKQSVEYDFYTSQQVKDLEVQIIYSGEGSFELNGITIEQNSQNRNIMILVAAIVFIICNILLLIKNDEERLIDFSIVMGITLLASLPVLMKGLAPGHDYRFHLMRIEGIANGIKNGELPVRLETSFNDGYGYPVAIFYGNLLLYIPGVLRVIGVSVTSAYKIYIVVINLLTTMSAFFCSKAFFRNQGVAAISAAAYVLGAYRLVDIYVRTAVGEFTAFMFIPMIFLGIYGIYNENRRCKTIREEFLIAFGLIGLIYTHILSTQMTMLILIVTAIIGFRKTFTVRAILIYLKAAIMTFLGGLSFIIPFWDYYNNVDTVIKADADNVKLIQEKGAYISDFFSFFKQVTGGSSEFLPERMQLTPGLILMLSLIGAIALIIIKKASKEIKVLTCYSIVLLFIASNLFPWNLLAENTAFGNFLSSVQFPWRYISIAIVCQAFLLGMVVEKILESGIITRNNLYTHYVILTIVTISTFLGSFGDLGWQINYLDTAELPCYTYSASLPNGLGAGEYLLEDTDIEILDYYCGSENADVEIIEETGLGMILQVKTFGESDIEVPRFNYPYYVACDETGDELEISNGYNNKISIHIPDTYDGIITLEFVEPQQWRYSEYISIITLCLMVVLVIGKKRSPLLKLHH